MGKVGFAYRLNPPYEMRWRLAVDAAHAQVFDFEEFLDAVFRAPMMRQWGRCRFPSCRRRGRSRQRDLAR
jgi:hypothetical protein